MKNFKVGDKVQVLLSPVVLRDNYRQNTKKEDWPTYKGMVQYVSEKWVTILLNSNKTGKPMYRECFWKDEVSLVK